MIAVPDVDLVTGDSELLPCQAFVLAVPVDKKEESEKQKTIAVLHTGNPYIYLTQWFLTFPIYVPLSNQQSILAFLIAEKITCAS